MLLHRVLQQLLMIATALLLAEARSDGDSSSSGDSEESDDLADVDPTLARELARDREFLWED